MMGEGGSRKRERKRAWRRTLGIIDSVDPLLSLDDDLVCSSG